MTSQEPRKASVNLPQALLHWFYRRVLASSGWAGTLASLAVIWATAVALVLHVREDESAVKREVGATLVRMAETLIADSLRAAEWTAHTAAQPLSERLLHDPLLNDPLLAPLDATEGETSEADRLLRRALHMQGVVHELAMVDSAGNVIAGSTGRRPARTAAQIDPTLLVELADGTLWHLLEGSRLGTARTVRHDRDAPAIAKAEADVPRLVARAWPMPKTPERPEQHWIVVAIDAALWSERLSVLLRDTDWHATIVDAANRTVATASALGNANLEPPSRPSHRSIGADLIVVERPIQGIDYQLRFELPARVVADASAGHARAIVIAALVTSIGTLAYGWAVRRSRQRLVRAQQTAVQASDRAEASEAELRSLVDSQPEWMFRTDAQGVLTFVNRHWQTLSGHEPARALGRPLAELVHPADALTVHSLFGARGLDNDMLAVFGADAVDDSTRTDAAAGGHCLVRLTTASGDVRELELSVANLTAGGEQGYAGFGVDITERERARRLAAAQYRLTEQVIEAIPQPVFLTNAQGELLMANRAWADWMADAALARGSEATSGSSADAHPPADSGCTVPKLLRLGLDSRTPDSVQRWSLELPRAAGRTREVVLSKAVLQYDGPNASSVIGTLMDVTEFKQAERATEQALRAAESAIASRTQFVANVSHELRTPLQSIIGFAELGRDRSEEGSRPQAMFGRIHDSGRRMLKLVEDLLDVSRLGSDMGRVKPEPLPLVAAVREVVDELQSLAAARGLTINCEAPAALEQREALIDPLRFGQVVRNVVANALRFAPAGTAIEVGVALRDGLAITTVRDHGPGIPADELEAVFEPFVQSSRTRDGAGGTGLGLAICRRIMTALNGHVTADNHPDGGAVFSIAIKLLPQRPAPADAAALQAPSREHADLSKRVADLAELPI